MGLFFDFFFDRGDKLVNLFGGQKLGLLFGNNYDFNVLARVVNNFAKRLGEQSGALHHGDIFFEVLLELVNDSFAVFTKS